MQNNYSKKNTASMRLLVMVSLMVLLCWPRISFAGAEINFGILENTRITLNVKDMAIVDIIAIIEQKTGLFVAYNSQKFDVGRHATLKVKNEVLEKVFQQLIKGYEGTVSELDARHIIISVDRPADKSGTTSLKDVQQPAPVRVSGIVKDENGETLPGVTVGVKGNNALAITDSDGRFTLEVEAGTVLVFSFIGFGVQEFTVVESTDSIAITLQGDSKFLDEVVVVGYGTAKRSNLGGAVGTADAKTFESRPVLNAANALQGVVPGLTVIREGGAPGNNPTLRIRDISSINGGSPLVLIDGAEGNLNLINPNDIESISVLKDGTAAIYGARAADGVVLVTTKNGVKNQSMKINVDTYYSVKTPALLKKPANLYQHAAMALEITDGSFPTEYTRDELAMIAEGSDVVIPTSRWGRWNYPKFYKNQDWNDMIIGNGNMQNYTLGISGGGDQYSYRVSLGTTMEEGLPKFGVDKNKRYFARIKTTLDLRKNIQYDINIAYEANDRSFSSVLGYGQNVWDLIYKTRSWAPMYNPAGRFYTFEGFDNPAQVLEEGGNTQNVVGNFTINNQLSWQPIEGLSIVGRAVVRKNDGDGYVTQKMIYNYNWEDINHRIARRPNSAERNYEKTLWKNFTAYADYKKTFGKHDVGLMVGTAHESSNYDRFWAKRINFDQQAHMPLNLGSPLNQDASSQGSAWTINSFFSRFNYAYASKYLFEATLRADGSSRFASDSRWGYFPGANVAWRVGEESFMKDLGVFDELKFRASYGEMGNQSGIGAYDYAELVTIAGNYYPFGNAQSGQLARQSNLVSTDRTWETVIAKNIGMDFSVLNDRLFGSFDYFWKVNENMLIPITYPSMLGVTAPATNSGRLEIQGWEVNLGWRDRIGELNYSVRANIGDARNTVVSRIGNNLIQLGINSAPQGYSTNSYFGYEFDGIIQNEQERLAYLERFPSEGVVQSLKVGDAKYKDLDGDGRLTVLGNGQPGSGDAVYLGNTNPRYTFGFNLGLDYKGFDLGVFLQGVGQRTMFLEGEARAPFTQQWFQSAEYWYGKTWTPERTDAKYPGITAEPNRRNYNYNVSTNTKHSVAYVRLKNIQLGYTIPQKYTQRLQIEKVRIYFSGEDLWESHNTPGGWDPEESGGHVSYPFTRNYSFGASFVF